MVPKNGGMQGRGEGKVHRLNGRCVFVHRRYRNVLIRMRLIVIQSLPLLKESIRSRIKSLIIVTASFTVV
jgi:hypothetical protein